MASKTVPAGNCHRLIGWSQESGRCTMQVQCHAVSVTTSACVLLDATTIKVGVRIRPAFYSSNSDTSRGPLRQCTPTRSRSVCIRRSFVVGHVGRRVCLYIAGHLTPHPFNNVYSVFPSILSAFALPQFEHCHNTFANVSPVMPPFISHL